MTTTGVMALETGAPIDFDRMLRERFQRALAAMERHGLDALLLAKPANVKYVSGIRSLWVAGRAGFVPAAIVLRERQELHLMTYWDFGVPRGVPRERLYPPSWNPMQILDSVRRVLGPHRVRRIGVDLMSTFFQRLLSEAFPNAGLVDGGSAMLEARAQKTPEEIACLRIATAIAEAALAEAIAALRPGVPERVLLGTFERRACELGTTTPVAQGGFCVQPLKQGPGAGPPLRQMASDRPIQAGELVTMSGGILYAGYESDVGRTWLCGSPAAGGPSPRQRALHARWREACDAMMEMCRPGQTAADLTRAFEGVAPLFGAPVAHGSGLGFEPPIAGAGLGAAEQRSVLRAGTVLVLQPYVWEEGAGGLWAKETVLVTEGAPERLTTLPHGPLAAA